MNTYMRLAAPVVVAAVVVAGCGKKDEAISPEESAVLIKPVARVELAGAAPAGAAALRTGEQVVQQSCGACHTAGLAGAPRTGDKAAWAPRLAQGMDALVKSVLNGKGGMPPKGGMADLQEIEAARAVVLLANQSGASFKEPAAPAVPAAAPAASAPAPANAATAAAAVDGKKVYEASCQSCHGTGAANAPKPGDKAAWTPRLAQGKDVLYKNAVNGKNLMPPKGGNPALSEAEIKAAVDHMVR